METVPDFILGGSKITTDGECSHEIKRHLLPVILIPACVSSSPAFLMMYSVYKLVAAAAAAAYKLLQSCPTLCDPIDSSPPGSAVPGILQARTLQ